MLRLARLVGCLVAIVLLSSAASADEGWYPIKADDGSIIANHRVSAEIEGLIERLPGAVVAGNLRGKITLNEFYDLNCPYCRKASADIDRLLRTNRELRLVLVPFPVLGIPSIQAGKVELAVRRHASPQAFYEFHRRTMAVRGVMDGKRAFAIAQAMGLDDAKVANAANENSEITETMIAHVRLGNALGIQATPGFVIKGVAINGYPGPRALEGILKSVERCNKVLCEEEPKTDSPPP